MITGSWCNSRLGSDGTSLGTLPFDAIAHLQTDTLPLTGYVTGTILAVDRIFLDLAFYTAGKSSRKGAGIFSIFQVTVLQRLHTVSRYKLRLLGIDFVA